MSRVKCSQNPSEIEPILAELKGLPTPSWADITDSYKLTHYSLYPETATFMQSHFESRGGRFPEIVHFGLQYFIIKYFLDQPVTYDNMAYMIETCDRHFDRPHIFNRDAFKIIIEEYDGHPPVRIRALPEGMVVPQRVPLSIVESIDDRLIALVNYIETLLVQVWYPTTVASQSRHQKRQILDRLKTSGTPETIFFKLHDFGCRGVTCPEQAALGGAAHLVNFMGTDTVPALRLLHRYYSERMAGFSIVATEHSVMALRGKEGELDQVRQVLDQYPTGLVAIVGDTYDIYDFCTQLGTRFKDRILGRDGTLVIRPDSGDPHEVLIEVLRILEAQFGATINEKGYKVLPPQVRLIQGDGIDVNTLDPILGTLEKHGWSADNLAFGSGGGLLMKMNRDTNEFAFKANASVVDGRPIDVYKDPVTAPGKRSKRGPLKVIRSPEGRVITLTGQAAVEDTHPDLMQVVYDAGELKVFDTLKRIRTRAALAEDEPA